MSDNVEIRAAIERAVVDTFLKRFGGRRLRWDQARELVILEGELIENIAFEIQEAIASVVGDIERTE